MLYLVRMRNGRNIELKRITVLLGVVPLVSACSNRTYEVIATAEAPDKAYIARLERLEEGTLGSTRYRLYIARADGSDSVEVFRGTGGWVSAPVWQNASTVSLPMCFGMIQSITSVLSWNGSDIVRYQTRNPRTSECTSSRRQIRQSRVCTSARADGCASMDGVSFATAVLADVSTACLLRCGRGGEMQFCRGWPAFRAIWNSDMRNSAA